MKYDYIIVGSGAGGSAAAYYLAQSGVRVLLIERGLELPRDGSTLDVGKVVAQQAFIEAERWLDRGGQSIRPQERSNLGGKTKWYGAALLRMAPHEFLGDPAHQCLPWPISFDELLPFYEAAERLLGVRTFEIEPDLGQIVGRVTAADSRWTARPLPMALSPDILDDADEARHFDGFASPRGLKGDAQTAFLDRVRGRSNLTVLTGKSVTALRPADIGSHTLAGVVCDDGTQYDAQAVLLAAGALHSPRLLQTYLEHTSLADRLPCARHVGRNYKFHVLTAVLGFGLKPQTDQLRKTTLLLHERLAHSSVQPLGWFDGELLSAASPTRMPRWVADALGKRVYGFFLQTEDGSHPDNRVIANADANGRSRLDYHLDRLPAARDEHRALVGGFKRALLRSGYLPVAEAISLEGSAHACGTLAAGNDPSTSVVDGDGRVHGLNNLYVVDGSVLPRSSRVNPALTIYAWSLRVASRLAKNGQGRHATDSTDSLSVSRSIKRTEAELQILGK